MRSAVVSRLRAISRDRRGDDRRVELLHQERDGDHHRDDQAEPGIALGGEAGGVRRVGRVVLGQGLLSRYGCLVQILGRQIQCVSHHAFQLASLALSAVVVGEGRPSTSSQAKGAVFGTCLSSSAGLAVAKTWMFGPSRRVSGLRLCRRLKHPSLFRDTIGKGHPHSGHARACLEHPRLPSSKLVGDGEMG